MPSILARLRKRTLSQQSHAPAQFVPAPSDSGPPADAPTLSTSRSEPLLVDRRIVEDLSALLGSLETGRSPSPTGALKPPRARKRSGLRTLGLGLKDGRPLAEGSVVTSGKEEVESLPAAATAGPSAWRGKQGSSRMSSTSSPWSTFGRHRQRTARSPYGHANSSHPPSARSSRIASVDSAAYRTSPMGNASEGQTVSNLTSSASVDHNSNSRPTDSSRDYSAVPGGSLSNQSSRSSNSVAITFGRQSPPLDTIPAAIAYAKVAYTSMPALPSTYSTENVPLRGNTFPRRHSRRKIRSRSRSHSVHRDIPRQYTTSANDFTTSERGRPIRVVDISYMPSEERPTEGRLNPEETEERPSASAITGTAPRTLHESGESATRCSPSRLIPSSLSSSFSTSPASRDVESRSDGVINNLSRSLPNPLSRGDRSWMADSQNIASTLSRQSNDPPQPASRTGPPSRTRSKRALHLSEQSTPSTSSSSKQNGGAGPSSAAFPTISTPTPVTPQRVPRTPRTASEPGLRSVSEKSVFEPSTPVGKRKAEHVDTTPPDQRVKFSHQFQGSQHPSDAPSSYQGRKRARLSTSSPYASPGHSRPTSIHRQPTDSWPSRSGVPAALHRPPSKSASMRSAARPESNIPHRERRRSTTWSDRSIPISALVAPRAPSVSVRSGGYHMRDPRKPPRVQPTPWSLRRNSEDEQGSPVHAWMFFLGFVLFPLWWVASFWRIPQTRHVGGTDTEKAVTLDDPQVEHDARSWRMRCRIMSVVSFFTYIPFIVLVAIFVPRS